MNNNYFRKVYFKDFLTTELDANNVEKKNLMHLLPKGWNQPDFDFTQPHIKDKKSAKGHVVIISSNTTFPMNS